MSTLPANIRLIDVGSPGNVVTTGPINAYNALSIPAYYRAMAFLADNLASFPRSVRKNGVSGEETDTPHPLDNMLALEPNPVQDAFTFWQTLYFHAAHYANGYAEIVRAPDGTPNELRNLLPDDVLPVQFDRDDGLGLRRYYVVARSRVLPAADVIHLSRLSYDGLAGMTSFQLHNGALRRASLLQAYVTKFLERGSVIRGTIEIPAGYDDDKVNQIVDVIRRFYTGVDAERDLLTLTDGAKLNNAAITPQSSQLAEQGALTSKDVAMITGVPPQFLYDNSDTKYVDNGVDVVKYTFRPWIEQAEAQLSLKLLTRAERASGLRVNINPDNLLRGDTKTQTEIALAKVKAGVTTANECRRELGQSSLDDPEANKLKTAGDTTPPSVTPPNDQRDAKVSA